MFIGRESELSYFEGKYAAPGGQLIVLYGRRRIGKTELLRRFCEGKQHVYYSCRELSDKNQLVAFSERILKAGIPAAKYIDSFQDWEAALKSILELPSQNSKKLLIIDEFPYMCRSNPSIPSIMQALWDESLKDQDVMIILCGSAMSFIENSILSEKNPLYGRATGIYKMNELPFDDAVKFFPDYSDEDKLLSYAILGGVPHYLRQFEPTLSLRDNILNNILMKGCVLYSEVEFLIRQELREPALYNTVIEAIALGNTRLNDIYTKTQIDKSKLSVYLKNLISLRILEREFSALLGEKERATSMRGLYRITDNYFRFWYSFVFPNLSDLERNDEKEVYEYAVAPKLNDFASPVFESVCREFVRKISKRGELPFRIDRLGRWWGKINKFSSTDNDEKGKVITMEAEIDIVAVDETSANYILGECKFRNSVMETATLDSLIEKSAIAKEGAEVRYMLFSKSGFSMGLAEQSIKDENLRLFSLPDIISK